MQVTCMKRAGCVKKPPHHLKACSPSAGFANKLISQGLGLAQNKQIPRGRKYRQWVSKSRREWSWMSARLKHHQDPSIQKRESTDLKKKKKTHMHTHSQTQNKNSSRIKRTFKWAQVASRKVNWGLKKELEPLGMCDKRQGCLPQSRKNLSSKWREQAA